MRNRVLLCLFLFFLITQAYAACRVQDDAGETVFLSQPANRIISLAPDLTEDLFALDAGHKIVGVIKGSDYPPAARQLSEVGSYSGIDLEKIVALHPDLILVWNHYFFRQVLALKKQGYPIYQASPKELTDIPHTLENLGCLVGNTKIAHEKASQFANDVEKRRKQYAGLAPMRVFYQIGAYSLITINKESWINQIIDLCGGVNVFAQARTIAPEVNWEAVIIANPEVVISDAPNPGWKKRWEKWAIVTAVKNKALYSVNPDLVERAGPRLLGGIKEICQRIDSARVKASQYS